MKSPKRPANNGVEILIVEDSPTQAAQLKLLLEQCGYTVTVAANGKQALQPARSRNPALIISDIVMPEMDGYALCKHVKSEEKLKDIPVILMTSLSSPEDVIKGLECGADNFVRKPYDKTSLLARIDYILANRRLHARAKMELALEIQLGGKIHHITSERRQILDLLISTYEDAIRINKELSEKQKELTRLAEGLERRVEERTAILLAEIAERKRAEEQLRQSEERFRLISENVADLIAVLDLEGKHLYNSPSYKEILGDPQKLRGTISFNEIHPEDRDRVKQTFQETVMTGRGQRGEFRFLLKDGTVRFIESQGSVILDEEGRPAKVVVVSRDITERKRLEQQLLQAQKMEAVGQLAGGIAHDFNNLLTIITGYSQLILDRLPSGDGIREKVEEIKKAGDRAASLTRQLLAFSRRQVLQPQVVDLNRVVANLDKMLQRLIGEDIDLVALCPPGVGRVKVDPGQIEQVILNLAVNARDAMPRGGKLTIETANVELDESYASNHVAVKPGPYVMLAASDTGHGMSPGTQAHIFEPFFTTKEQGKGTGLGLSTVYGIVKQSGGNIWVYSEPGKGATFKIYLPRVEEAPQPMAEVELATAGLQGTETILLVEDEAAVRLLVRGTLEQSGYHVLDAGSGAEALVMANERKQPIHLLVTDVVMPGMSGRQVAEQVALSHPETKVLFMSGYTDDAIVRHGVLESSAAFVQKPFTPDALLRKIREVLDVKPPASGQQA